MRITPACAGNKINYSWIKYRSQDHPRVCGEQGRLLISVSSWQGSPPRVRGTGAARSRGKIFLRITPACAGNSIFLRRQSEPPRDHPRVCGEQCLPIMPWLTMPGSPPRMRGTEGGDLRAGHAERITPACARNSASTGLRGWIIEDHPRVCGEQGAAACGL